MTEEEFTNMRDNIARGERERIKLNSEESGFFELDDLTIRFRNDCIIMYNVEKDFFFTISNLREINNLAEMLKAWVSR